MSEKLNTPPPLPEPAKAPDFPPESQDRSDAQPAGFSYTWVTNENLLRDEAIMAAFTRNAPAPYLELIEGYYAILKSPFETELETKMERKSDLQTQLGEKQVEVAALEQAIFQQWPRVPLQSHAYFRKLAGAIGYGALISTNLVLAWWWMAPLTEWSFILAAGGYLTGLFMLFHQDSFFLSGDEARFPANKPHQERWKVWLEEFGAPIASTLLIVGMGWQFHPGYFGLVVSLFLLMLFLLGGKSFLSLLSSLPAEYQTYRENRRLRRLDKAHRAQQEGLLKASQEASGKLAEGLTALEEEVMALNKHIHKLHVEAAAASRYFLSEFTLAESSLNQFGHDLLTQLKPTHSHE